MNDLNNLANCCRLCLNQTVFLSVFDNNYDYLQQKILACLNIEVREFDKISIMICQRCLVKVEDFYEYRLLCQKSQFTLYNWLNSYEGNSSYPNISSEIQIDGQNFDENVQIKQEPLTLPPEDVEPLNEEPLTIEDCPYEYVDVCENFANDYYRNSTMVSNETLQMVDNDNFLIPSSECEVSNHGLEILNDTTCQICKKNFCSSSSRFRHEKNVHKDTQNEFLEPLNLKPIEKKMGPIQNTPKVDPLNYLPCKYCPKNFKKLINLQKHQKTVHKNKKNRKLYIRDTNPDSKLFNDPLNIIYTCNFCPKNFMSLENQIEHEKTHQNQNLGSQQKLSPKSAQKLGKFGSKSGKLSHTTQKTGNFSHRSGNKSGNLGILDPKAGNLTKKLENSSDFGQKSSNLVQKSGNLVQKSGNLGHKSGNLSQKSGNSSHRLGNLGNKSGNLGNKSSNLVQKSGKNSELVQNWDDLDQNLENFNQNLVISDQNFGRKKIGLKRNRSGKNLVSENLIEENPGPENLTFGSDLVENFACKSCPKTFLNQKSLIWHEENSHKKIKLSLSTVCNYCPKNFRTIANKLQHEKIKHKKELARRNFEKINPPLTDEVTELPHLCNFCPKRYATSKWLNKHEKLHHSSEKCKKESEDPKNSGPDSKNPGVKLTFDCKKCPKSFRTLQKLLSHEKHYHKDKIDPNKGPKNGLLPILDPISDLVCQICSQTFRASWTRKRHEEKCRKVQKIPKLKIKGALTMAQNDPTLILAKNDNLVAENTHLRPEKHNLGPENDKLGTENDTLGPEIEILKPENDNLGPEFEISDSKFGKSKKLSKKIKIWPKKARNKFKCQFCPQTFRKFKNKRTHERSHSEYTKKTSLRSNINLNEALNENILNENVNESLTNETKPSLRHFRSKRAINSEHQFNPALKRSKSDCSEHNEGPYEPNLGSCESNFENLEAKAFNLDENRPLESLEDQNLNKNSFLESLDTPNLGCHDRDVEKTENLEAKAFNLDEIRPSESLDTQNLDNNRLLGSSEPDSEKTENLGAKAFNLDENRSLEPQNSDENRLLGSLETPNSGFHERDVEKTENLEGKAFNLEENRPLETLDGQNFDKHRLLGSLETQNSGSHEHDVEKTENLEAKALNLEENRPLETLDGQNFDKNRLLGSLETQNLGSHEHDVEKTKNLEAMAFNLDENRRLESLEAQNLDKNRLLGSLETQNLGSHEHDVEKTENLEAKAFNLDENMPLESLDAQNLDKNRLVGSLETQNLGSHEHDVEKTENLEAKAFNLDENRLLVSTKRQYLDKNRLLETLEAQNDKKFNCKICKIFFGTLSEWAEHQKIHLMCPKCPKKFTSAIAFDEHQKNHLKAEKIHCSTSNYSEFSKIFPKNPKIQIFDSDTDSYTCQNCQKVFKSCTSFYFHQKRHHLSKSEPNLLHSTEDSILIFAETSKNRILGRKRPVSALGRLTETFRPQKYNEKMDQNEPQSFLDSDSCHQLSQSVRNELSGHLMPVSDLGRATESPKPEKNYEKMDQNDPQLFSDSDRCHQLSQSIRCDVTGCIRPVSAIGRPTQSTRPENNYSKSFSGSCHQLSQSVRNDVLDRIKPLSDLGRATESPRPEKNYSESFSDSDSCHQLSQSVRNDVLDRLRSVSDLGRATESPRPDKNYSESYSDSDSCHQLSQSVRYVESDCIRPVLTLGRPIDNTRPEKNYSESFYDSDSCHHLSESIKNDVTQISNCSDSNFVPKSTNSLHYLSKSEPNYVHSPEDVVLDYAETLKNRVLEKNRPDIAFGEASGSLTVEEKNSQMSFFDSDSCQKDDKSIQPQNSCFEPDFAQKRDRFLCFNKTQYRSKSEMDLRTVNFDRSKPPLLENMTQCQKCDFLAPSPKSLDVHLKNCEIDPNSQKSMPDLTKFEG